MKANPILINSLATIAGAIVAHGNPLTIYDGLNQTGPSAIVAANSRKTGTAIPNGLNDKISSFKLQNGYGVCFGMSFRNVGESKVYFANNGDRNVNLPTQLNDNVSFIRVFPIKTDVKKKGHAGTNTALGKAVGASWYYLWSDGGSDGTDGLKYVPMKWGIGTPSTFADKWASIGVSHMLAFNEPDNPNQANATVANAVTSYEDLLACGLTMGSPVVEQDKYKTWLKDFMADCKTKKLRVDFLAAHWYDWGNQTNVSTGAQIKDRLSAKMTDLRTQIGGSQYIWLTEFNANPNRTKQSDHAAFISSAIGWMNSTSWMQRYAYFQNGGGKFETGTPPTLSESGKAYRDAPNANAGYGIQSNLGY
ncbi:MAG: glycoside hydrolase family protein [Akkermansiaceae bacterium]|jgi:hypothetical protein|nr:glycoside hydrolase family protein [Akkermansiaceae bacterium]